MAKVRAYKIAEELGIERSEFVERAKEAGFELKNAMTAVIRRRKKKVVEPPPEPEEPSSAAEPPTPVAESEGAPSVQVEGVTEPVAAEPAEPEPEPTPEPELEPEPAFAPVTPPAPEVASPAAATPRRPAAAGATETGPPSSRPLPSSTRRRSRPPPIAPKRI